MKLYSVGLFNRLLELQVNLGHIGEMAPNYL